METVWTGIWAFVTFIVLAYLVKFLTGKGVTI